MPGKDEIYRIWAPPETLWSRWVKPILFSFVDGVFEGRAVRSVCFERDWIPPAGSTAIVLDLSEDDSVLWSIDLARLGYRPVPLYNALPFPLSGKMTAPASRPTCTVHMEPILASLVREASVLDQVHLASDAPPVFLLNADRRRARSDVASGVFDNRSVCFVTDFPSADFLLTHGIRGAIVVQESEEFARDLIETLVSWQQGGVQIFCKRRGDTSQPSPVVVKRPSFLSVIWFRLGVALGLRRSELGGFGGIVPASSG
jgi:hypothetical protein